jgi:glutamyl-tRNA reductase
VNLFCFGLDYQNAPMALLEEASLAQERLVLFLRSVAQHGCIREIFGLSTCNRTEFYVITTEPSAAKEAIIAELAACKSIVDVDRYRYCLFTHRHETAVTHLMRVSAGIESLVVGETEILGQIRRAQEGAQLAGTLGAQLGLLLNRALAFGRRVRSETNISRGNVSVASVAHRLARQEIEALGGKTLLVIGAGETARTSARHFVDEGVGQLYVLNRTAAHSEAIASELGGRTLPLDRLETGLELADVVVCAVGAPHYIITPGGIADIMARRDDRPLFLIDISMPRNIDPECGSIEGVRLCALEQLEAIAAENRQQREGEVAQVSAMVEAEVAAYLRLTHATEAGLLVTAIRRQMEEIRQQQLARYGAEWSPEERERMERFSATLTRSMLHDLTANIRAMELVSEDDQEALEVVRRLFNVPLDVLQDV